MKIAKAKKILSIIYGAEEPLGANEIARIMGDETANPVSGLLTLLYRFIGPRILLRKGAPYQYEIVDKSINLDKAYSLYFRRKSENKKMLRRVIRKTRSLKRSPREIPSIPIPRISMGSFETILSLVRGRKLRIIMKDVTLEVLD